MVHACKLCCTCVDLQLTSNELNHTIRLCMNVFVCVSKRVSEGGKGGGAERKREIA